MPRARVAVAGMLAWIALVATAVHAQPASQPAAQVFCLDATYRPQNARQRQSLLVREIVRQAVLIAAREELSLPTRDAVLREPFPAGARVFDVEIETNNAGEFGASLVERTPGAKATPLWQRSKTVDGRYPELLPNVVALFDAGTFAEIAKALKGAGLTSATARRADAEAALPPGTEERLLEMNEFAQFAALRQLHTALRDGRESPAVLGGLVRAYANLGQLTQFHWSARHQAFKARALLYAQRMAAAQPDAPQPLWHRAYAWSMAGMHAEVIEALSGAAERVKAKPVEPPPWVALVDAAARYQTRELLDAFSEDRNAPTAPLAAYLCFLTVENGSSLAALMQFGDAARQLNPSCVRLIDAMTNSGGVSAQHQTTLEAAEVFKGSIFRDLLKIPGLPQSIRDVVTESQKQANVPKVRADIAAAIVAAGDATRDTAEPSWATLGRLMQDTYFAQTHRRVYFIAFMWGIDQSDVASFVELAKTLIGDHPYMPVLEAYANWHNWPKALALLKGVTFRDVNWAMYPLIQRAGSVPELNVGQLTLWKLMLANQDDTAVDLEQLIRSYFQRQTEYKTTIARILNSVSPHSPVGVAALIEGNWDESQAKVAGWEKEFAGHPAVSAALARQYARLGKLDDAKRMWEASLAVSPDIEGYRALAQIHLQERNEPEWLATLEKALTAEDYGLGHARVRVDIAEHFMSKQDYRRALPYAEEAAQTWAAWAMWCASHCHEGLEDWKNAELWARRVAERYESSWAEWYVFCRRTGKGDERAALRLARKYVARAGDPANVDTARFCGMIHLLAREPRPAAKYFSAASAKFKDADSGMLAALAHDAAGDAAARDAAWDALLAMQKTIEKPEEWRRFFELVTLLKQHSAGAGSKDPANVEAHLLGKPEAPAKAFYWAGRFFRTRGNDQAAKTLFARCATTSTGLYRTLASAELRELGVEPRTLKAPTTNPATQPTR